MDPASYVASLFNVEGRVALVTGARRGLGRGMAEGLARAGAQVAVAAKAPSGEEVLASIADFDGQAAYFQADLSDRTERQGLIPRVLNRFGRLDILVNCAGLQRRAPALEFPLEEWDRLLSVMLTAVFELCRQAAQVMVPQGGGKIINIASLAAFQGGWTIPAYAAAKHGVVGLTRALANEWASKNINVNAIAPGYFATDMCEAILKDPIREPRIRERIPAGRWGQPDDLIGAVLYLASPASAYVHGETLVVDGGWMGR